MILECASHLMQEYCTDHEDDPDNPPELIDNASNTDRERAERMHERRKEQGLNVDRKKKLGSKEPEDVYKWREKGISYGHIATSSRKCMVPR